MNQEFQESYMDRVLDSAITLFVGGSGIAIITLTDLKDWVAVFVGIVTAVCLIYNTFFRKDRKRK